MASRYSVQNCSNLLTLIGICLAIYALYIEHQKENDIHFEAMCDISDHVSCSKVFNTKYGKGFGVLGKVLGEDHILNQPNSVFGVVFYCCLYLLGLSHDSRFAALQFVIAATSNLMSIYLACILYFVLYNLCVVCVCTYIVNGLLTVSSYYNWKLKSGKVWKNE